MYRRRRRRRRRRGAKWPGLRGTMGPGLWFVCAALLTSITGGCGMDMGVGTGAGAGAGAGTDWPYCTVLAVLYCVHSPYAVSTARALCGPLAMGGTDG